MLVFADLNDIADLKTMLLRLETVGLTDVALKTSARVLSVFGSTQGPAPLGVASHTVLVHRAFKLLSGEVAEGTTVVPARSILDRFARLNDDESFLKVPKSSIFASWAGTLPGKSGWQKAGMIDPFSLQIVAKDGIARVAKLLPSDAGAPVVDRVRRSVWDLEIAPGVPAGAAFALETLGFLQDLPPVSLSVSAPWLKLSTVHGDVFVRSGSALTL